MSDTVRALSSEREAFHRWFYGSKYAQVSIPSKGTEQTAWDGWQARAERATVPATQGTGMFCTTCFGHPEKCDCGVLQPKKAVPAAWIAVSEQRPPDLQRVVGYFQSGRLDFTYWSESRGEWGCYPSAPSHWLKVDLPIYAPPAPWGDGSTQALPISDDRHPDNPMLHPMSALGPDVLVYRNPAPHAETPLMPSGETRTVQVGGSRPVAAVHAPNFDAWWLENFPIATPQEPGWQEAERCSRLVWAGALASHPPAVPASPKAAAWYSAKVDDCITDAKKRSRAKVQPCDAEHYSQPLYAAVPAVPVEPAGWKFVPIEPTDDMLIAGQEAWMCCRKSRPAMEDCEEAVAAYKAMLAASPLASGLDHSTERPIEGVQPPLPPEVRYDTKGALDEVVGEGKFHLEQMSATHWWMCFESANRGVHVNLNSRGVIKANVIEEDYEPDTE